MGFINPNQIDEDAFEEDRRPLFLEDEAAPLESPNTNKIRSPIAIVRRYIQRSAERAVQEQLAGVYAYVWSDRGTLTQTTSPLLRLLVLVLVLQQLTMLLRMLQWGDSLDLELE